MNTQQRQIDELLSRRGWRVVERLRPSESWWLDEVWTAESLWSPQGLLCKVVFLVDPMWKADARKATRVWAVAVAPPLPNGTDSAEPMWLAPRIPLRPRWKSRGLPELHRLIDGLRGENS